MSSYRAIHYMVRADFLERVRRYSFLLTLGFSVYLGYAVFAGQISLRASNYRGIENSAWLGTVMGLVATMFLTLTGFYFVKNSIQRDRETRVGQILASTPISKGFYSLSKALSNFVVLASMLLLLAGAAVAIQLVHREDAHLDLFALLAPILILGLTSVAVTASLAVLFESIRMLRGGVGNVLYFFLWLTLISVGIATMVNSQRENTTHAFTDFTGMASAMGQMQDEVRSIDPHYPGGVSFTIGGLGKEPTKTFLYTGIQWNPALLLSRVMMLGIAILLAWLAAFFFDRFDPARADWFEANTQTLTEKGKRSGIALALTAILNGAGALAQKIAVQSTAFLPAISNDPELKAAGSNAAVQARFFALVRAELRLLLRGHAWWWYLGATGLFIACLASPSGAARSGVIVVAWLWPVLVWSQMGTRETQFSTGALIFSAPHAVPRQLLATFASGALLAALTGGGLALHLVIVRDFSGLAAWAAGALFIPALALALGVASGSRKFFESLYTAWWYIGPAHHIRKLDFMGTTPESSTPARFLAAAVVLVMVAYSWRRVRLARA
jgi:hypothetical protein